MTKQEQIEEIAKIVDEMYNVYTTTADDIAEGIYNAGYRKTFTSDLASDTQKAFKDGYEKGLDDGISLNKAFYNEKCAEFNKLCYDYNKLLYIIRCNMTSITRYVRNENEAYDARYKELAEKAVENILEAINHRGEE